jgi:hypothetical protein
LKEGKGRKGKERKGTRKRSGKYAEEIEVKHEEILEE